MYCFDLDSTDTSQNSRADYGEPDLTGIEEKLSLLNSEQRKIVDKVMTFLRHQQKCKTADCNCPRRGCSPAEPLREFITGVGGTGNS